MWEDENIVSLVVHLVCCWVGGECNNQPSMGVVKVMNRTVAGEGLWRWHNRQWRDGIRGRGDTRTTTMATGVDDDDDDDDDDGDGARGNKVDDEGNDKDYGNGR